MLRAAQVNCPDCGTAFLVPEHATETLCPSCDAHIVWRRCLATGEAFPVLSKWETWVHPGCGQVHRVDLTERIRLPRVAREPAGQDRSAPAQHAGPEPPAPTPAAGPAHTEPAGREELQVITEDATWVEQELQGWLRLDGNALCLVTPVEDGEQPRTIALMKEVTEFAIMDDEAGGPSHSRPRPRPRHSPPSIRLALQTTTGSATLDLVADPKSVRDALLSVMSGDAWLDARTGALASTTEVHGDAVQDNLQTGVEGGGSRRAR